MQHYDALIVGGGPAGSACARKLVLAGRKVAVLDREEFPRTKLCAGWVTPEAVADLELDVDAYPHRFSTFKYIIAHIKGLTFKLDTPQHSIRRFEFDDFLLKRCGADVHVHNVKNIERDGADYVIDQAFRAPYLIGAGGTRCPVYRSLFRDRNPRARELQAATYEHEFPYAWDEPHCHLWFFDKGLPGYAWYVPKADAYLNCGIGGMAEKLKAGGDDIKSHWRRSPAFSRSVAWSRISNTRRRDTVTICGETSTWCVSTTRLSPEMPSVSPPAISARASVRR
jgi:flavin-dependent dehydrogenase